ncbi:MAG: sigma-54 dependent transcriptional regulator [Geopsychrobacter sp.]|nr:sigma-54 dependent transcriptional regulator [Geopsychrobacter sp.]
MNQLDLSSTHLPAVVPDLLLHKKAGLWQVRQISARLASLCNISQKSLIGRLLSRLFPHSSPPLEPLLDEVANSEQHLNGVKLRLGPDGDSFLADLHFAGRDQSYSPQVQISLRAESLASQLETGYAGLIGTSPAMREVFRKIELYADTEATVVITGETGCGKELVASALHRQSGRSQGPFAAINCSAISEQLLESELFGHDKGAFTGAIRAHRGHFEQADGGTLFLDEVGDMPLVTQGKLLRVLEDGQIQPVGSERSRKVEVRVVAATNVPLEQAVSDGRFRADLYHRLAVLRIHLPALRDRGEDIALLVEHFLQQFNRRYQKQIARFTPEAMSILRAYLWPGNIRELRNLVERLVIETQAAAIGGRALAEWVRERQAFQPGGLQLTPLSTRAPLSPGEDSTDSSVIDIELLSASPARIDRAALQSAFQRADGNLSAAARLLGIHRATFYRHLERLDLKRSDLSRSLSDYP